MKANWGLFLVLQLMGSSACSRDAGSDAQSEFPGAAEIGSREMKRELNGGTSPDDCAGSFECGGDVPEGADGEVSDSPGPDCTFTSSCCGPAPCCCDGVIGPGEDCDDSNKADNDGCDEQCKKEDWFMGIMGEITYCGSTSAQDTIYLLGFTQPVDTDNLPEVAAFVMETAGVPPVFYAVSTTPGTYWLVAALDLGDDGSFDVIAAYPTSVTVALGESVAGINVSL